jgi:NAD+-dependent protein deacetylase sirtuin 4
MTNFVPQVTPDLRELPRLQELMATRRTAVLTGAGCSTASGIPDYRGPVTGKKKRSPILYQEFVKSEEARRRYWARSAVGWPAIRHAHPNDGHRALKTLEHQGGLSGVITQNVDGLHSRAGSQQLVELHGALSRVICLDCRELTSRDAIQAQLIEENPSWNRVCARDRMAPDGDIEIPHIPDDFRVPHCICGGLLKPDVVFFGENVAKSVLAEAWKVLEDADLLLVVGSSLTVYSGFRFVRAAKERGLPVALINIGPTRADDLVDLKVEAPCCEALGRLAC